MQVSTEQSLPKKLCNTCVDLVTSSYLFIKLRDFSTKTWSKVLETLSNSLEETTTSPNIKAAYLLMNEYKSITLTSRKNHSSHSKQEVLINIKKTVLGKHNNGYKKRRNTTKVKCEECGEIFSSKFVLSKHKVTVHNKTHNPCPHCPKIYISPIKLEDHIEKAHFPKKLQCPKCGEMFSTERVLRHHIEYSHTSVMCKLCFLKFPSKKALRSHMDRHDIFKCPRCERVLNTKYTFKVHIKSCGNSEEKTNNFFCDICGKGYVRKNSIRSHLKIDHGFGDVICCKWCGKKFDAVSKLRNHSVKHTRERNFYCEHCGNKFVTQAALINHVRLHTGERPYPCDLCDQTFLSASRRMDHKRSKHFEPTKQCPVCSTKFVTKHMLKKHVRRHYNPHSKLYCPDADELSIGTIMVS